MFINKEYHIEEACADKKDPRLGIKQVLYTGKELIATDGHIMAVVKTEDHDDEYKDTPGLITPESIKAARKLCKKHDSIVIRANGNISLQDGTTMPRTTDEQFPQYQHVLNSCNTDHNRAERSITFALNARLLYRLSNAISKDGALTLTIIPDEEGNVLDVVFVTPLGDNGNKGLIMPMRIRS